MACGFLGIIAIIHFNIKASQNLYEESKLPTFLLGLVLYIRVIVSSNHKLGEF